MAYIEGRVVHDADSHIFEPPGYAERYADPGMRETLRHRPSGAAFHVATSASEPTAS